MNLTIHIPWFLTQKLFWLGFASAFGLVLIACIVLYIMVGLYALSGGRG